MKKLASPMATGFGAAAIVVGSLASPAFAEAPSGSSKHIHTEPKTQCEYTVQRSLLRGLDKAFGGDGLFREFTTCCEAGRYDVSGQEKYVTDGKKRYINEDDDICKPETGGSDDNDRSTVGDGYTSSVESHDDTADTFDF